MSSESRAEALERIFAAEQQRNAKIEAAARAVVIARSRGESWDELKNAIAELADALEIKP